MKRSRRQFIGGRWLGGATLSTPDGRDEIASILVQTLPERLADAEAAIAAIPGTEIYQRDERGKLVVIVEGTGDDPVGATLTRLSLLPEVISATLVYHATDVPPEEGAAS